MKRSDALAMLRVAGYHDNTKQFTRLYIENRISAHVARQEFNKGAAMKKNGVPCTCHHCLKEKK